MTMPYFGSTTPYPKDTKLVALFKILGTLNNINGGPVSQPNFFPEGSTPLMQDTEWKVIMKILGALNELSASGGGLSSRIYTGTGDPNGVVTANPGSIYIDTTDPLAPEQWIKGGGTGNTGWL